MLFLQKTHTIPWTLDLSRWHPTPPGETRKHSQLIPIAPPKEERYLQRLILPTAPSFRQIYAETEYTTETAKHKTVNRKTTNNNEVLTVV